MFVYELHGDQYLTLLYLIFFINAWMKIHNDTNKVADENCCECSE